MPFAAGQLAVFSRRARSAHISIDTGRASNAEKQPTGRGPEGCDVLSHGSQPCGLGYPDVTPSALKNGQTPGTDVPAGQIAENGLENSPNSRGVACNAHWSLAIL